MQAPIRPGPTKTRAKSLGPRRASLKKTTTPSMHAAPGADRTTPPSQTATADRHAAERRAARRLETARQAPAQRTLDRRRTSTHRTPAYGTLAAVQARPCPNESNCAPRSCPKRLPSCCSGFTGPHPAPPLTRSGNDMTGGSGGLTSADDSYGLQTRRTQRTTPSAPAETMVWASSQTAAFTPPAWAFLSTAFCIGRSTDHT